MLTRAQKIGVTGYFDSILCDGFVAKLLTYYMHGNQLFEVDYTPESREAANKEATEYLKQFGNTEKFQPFTGGLPQSKPSAFLTCIAETKSKNLKPFLSVGATTTLVSQTVKDYIEDVEPGVHNFYEVQVLLKDGSSSPETYYILNICSLIKALDLEKSEIQVYTYTEEQKKAQNLHKDRNMLYNPSLSYFPDKPIRLFVKKEIIKNRTVWCEDGFHKAYYFVSEAFFDFVESIGGFGPAGLVEAVGEV